MSFVFGILLGLLLHWFYEEIMADRDANGSASVPTDPTISSRLAALEAAQRLAAAAWVAESAMQAEAKKHQQPES